MNFEICQRCSPRTITKIMFTYKSFFLERGLVTICAKSLYVCGFVSAVSKENLIKITELSNKSRNNISGEITLVFVNKDNFHGLMEVFEINGNKCNFSLEQQMYDWNRA